MLLGQIDALTAQVLPAVDRLDEISGIGRDAAQVILASSRPSLPSPARSWSACGTC